MIDIISLLRPKKTKKTAGEIAKERLKLVLIHDRSNCSGDLLEKIRKDIMDVLSKYMEIDMDALDIRIDTTMSDDDSSMEVPALYANIPIKNLKQNTKDEEKDSSSLEVQKEEESKEVKEKKVEKEKKSDNNNKKSDGESE